jgi:uncharacterized membrane protein YccC
MPIGDDYGVPRGTTRLPVLRMWVLMLALPVIALVLWLVLPDSPITVGVLVIMVLAIVGSGVFWVLSARGLNEPPRRDPRPRNDA